MSERQETRRKRETSALVHLVFSRGMKIDEGMALIAESHFLTVRAWAVRGQLEFAAFADWIKQNTDEDRAAAERRLDRSRLAGQLAYWRSLSIIEDQVNANT